MQRLPPSGADLGNHHNALIWDGLKAWYGCMYVHIYVHYRHGV